MLVPQDSSPSAEGMEGGPERLARAVAEQAAALLQARLRALPQAPRAARRQIERVQEWPAALRRRAPPWEPGCH